MVRKITRTLTAAAVGLLVAGCTVGPDYRAPALDMPVTWVGPTTQPALIAAATQPTTATSAATTQPASLSRWWTNLDDPTLDSLIDRAIASNLDLRQAQARLRQARAARGVAASVLWPSADASASYSRRGAGTGTGDANSRELYTAGLDAAWEIDVFGGNRRSVEAADADVASAVEDARDVLISVTAEVALSYVDLRGFQRQIQIAQRNLAAQERTLDVTRRRGGAGFVGSLDVAQAEAQVATTRSQIPLLEASARQATYALGVLLGREPGALLDELSRADRFPRTPAQVPVGLPSDLLLRRPDVRRAASDLRAATARVGVAVSDLYPRFSLTGSFGLEGDKPRSLTDAANHFWSIGPSIRWPVFTAGQVRSNIAEQRAAAEQVLIAYKATVLTALADVEGALIAFDREQARRATLADAVAANRRAVELANTLYLQGETDFLNVLTAQRSLLASEDALEQSDRTVTINLIALYKALGGGW
jgi:NodT family efflux transporter outer membrane factor (OMF) lipoprotein